MANDPNRDILPVKETVDRASCDRIEQHLVSRYRRPDLEDKFMKLYEENIELKRLNSVQDGKIKKLGTKLARHLRDKNGSQPFFSGRQGDAELEIKVHELEHENYALKDKNTVLKQQLASHSRQHMAAHRSPVIYHPAPSSARLSQRQASVPNIHEESYTLSNRQSSTEMQLQDAEAHISALNHEMKNLYDQNKLLRIEIEKTTIVSQKTQDGENIELLRLRQQTKQLEAQIRVAEHNQKLLKHDLARLQNENEDALIIITDRQNEIIDLQSKIDDGSRLCLELQECKEIVGDLTRERDILKERCEALMLTIREKSVDTALHGELKRQLSDAKSENVGLRQELELATASNVEATPQGSSKKTCPKFDSFTQTDLNRDLSDDVTEAGNSQVNSARSLTQSESPYDILQQLAKLRNVEKTMPVETTASVTNFSPASDINPVETSPASKFMENFTWPSVLSPSVEQSLTAAAERLNLQRETDCLRDLLRASTQRCDLQDNQILRLQHELKAKEERYKDVFDQRDLFFRLLDRESSRVQSARIVEEPDGKPLPDSEDSEDCPSQCTYIKQNGTYTKNSPTAKSFSEVSSPIHGLRNDIQGNAPKVIDLAQETPPVPVPRRRPEQPKLETPSISLTILWMQLEDGSSIMTDSAVKALYVDFTILSRSSENFETPQALPKPVKANQKLSYNFTSDIICDKKFVSDFKTFKDKNPQGDCVIFNVVSEPVAEESASEVECLIVGMSAIGFNQFTAATENKELLLPVYEIGKEKKCCGTLAVRLNKPWAIFQA